LAALFKRAWLMIVSMAMVLFASRAVADNQLALSATDGNHRVDCHDSCLHR